MKIDPYHHQQRYVAWKEKNRDRIAGIGKVNSDAILQYLSDMENGLNISVKSAKGPRSYIRLNNLKQRMVFLAKQIRRHCRTDLTAITEEQIVTFFNAMRNGTLPRRDGKPYRSVVDFVKPFKAFWHWHMKVHKRKGIDIPDITQDIDTSNPKPRWVYLTQEQVMQLCDHAKPEYKVLILFLYDTGLRSPVELINVRVFDLQEDCRKLDIREEIVKKGSFGRKINVMLCSEMIAQHIRQHNLQRGDYLFPISPAVVNQYLKRLAARVLGDGVSPAGKRYSELTLYDLRHCSCCYWLPRYKSESALKYRFGWKKSDKIHYYSELLGMKDTIQPEDMLIDLSKTEIEKQLLRTDRENRLLKEKVQAHVHEIEALHRQIDDHHKKLICLEQDRLKTHELAQCLIEKFSAVQKTLSHVQEKVPPYQKSHTHTAACIDPRLQPS